jgi:hypothetical protein
MDRRSLGGWDFHARWIAEALVAGISVHVADLILLRITRHDSSQRMMNTLELTFVFVRSWYV